jgi:hypothetical protein
MATNYNLNITRGSEYSVRLIAKDDDGATIDLTGYSTKGIVKNKYSDSTILLDLDPTIANATAGYIDIKLLGSETIDMPITQAVYDIEIYNGTYANKLIHGYVNFYPEVTT